MANTRQPCTIPGCNAPSKGRGLCQRHYDMYYGKIRRERNKLLNKEKPFLKFTNPYRPNSGYNIIFEVIRTNKPLTQEQIARRARAELVKAGKSDYRVDYALEVIKAKQHASRRGDYQIRVDNKGRWHMITDRETKHET